MLGVTIYNCCLSSIFLYSINYQGIYKFDYLKIELSYCRYTNSLFLHLQTLFHVFTLKFISYDKFSLLKILYAAIVICFRQRAIFKLQRQLLECVGVFSLKLKVPAIEVEKLAHACFPYLSCHQPDQLQEACVVCFKHLIKLDPDTMWLLLQQLVPVGCGSHTPSSSLKATSFPSLSTVGGIFTQC